MGTLDEKKERDHMSRPRNSWQIFMSRVFVDCFDTKTMQNETKPLFRLVLFLIVIVQFAYTVLFIVEVLIVDKHIVRHIIILAVVYTLVALLLLFSMFFLELIYYLKFGHQIYDDGIDDNVRCVITVRALTVWFFVVGIILLWVDYTANINADGIVSQYWYERVIPFHRVISFIMATITIIHMSLLVITLRGYYTENQSVIIREFVERNVEQQNPHINVKHRSKKRLGVL